MEEKAAARRRRHRKAEPWFVYILRCADGSLYTGITNDLPRRLKQHNDGTGARYTRTRRPVTLAYREECRDRSAALVRECAVKAYPRPRKQALIAGTCASAPSVAESRKKATSPESFPPWARPGPRRRSGRRQPALCSALRYLSAISRRQRDQQAARGLRIEEQILHSCGTVEPKSTSASGRAVALQAAGPAPAGTSSSAPAKSGSAAESNDSPTSVPSTISQAWPEQAEAGHVGAGVDAASASSSAAWRFSAAMEAHRLARASAPPGRP